MLPTRLAISMTSAYGYVAKIRFLYKMNIPNRHKLAKFNHSDVPSNYSAVV